MSSVPFDTSSFFVPPSLPPSLPPLGPSLDPLCVAGHLDPREPHRRQAGRENSGKEGREGGREGGRAWFILAFIHPSLPHAQFSSL